MSVTLVHPAKATGRNEKSFGRDIHVVLSNTVLYCGPGPPWEVKIWGGGRTPVHSDAAHRQIALVLVLVNTSTTINYCYLLKLPFYILAILVLLCFDFSTFALSIQYEHTAQVS